jgi:uncharacterized membrane protein
MALDYPLYQEMKRRGSPAASLWLAGDRMYYAGLLTAVIGTPLTVAVTATLAFALCQIVAAGAIIFVLGALQSSFSGCR